jgi:predicted component of type VI protein secretion system
VLSIGWKELARDVTRALEFDQSQLFRHVYSSEFDMPGGEPYGVLLGDYAVHRGPAADHPVDDLAVMRGVSGVAAAPRWTA